MEKITAVFTSCGRPGLLRETVLSFLTYKQYDIEKYIVIDNSANNQMKPILENIFESVLHKATVIINDENIGQVASIDKAYSLVETPYIFHCEDDWEFYDFDFIRKSLDILYDRPDISNINLRARGDGTKGSFHPIGGELLTSNGTTYHEYIQNYLGEWHGFSWNPGLRRLSDYEKIKPYSKYYNEQGVNQIMKNLGYKAACLSDTYCRHIGENSSTPKSNI